MKKWRIEISPFLIAIALLLIFLGQGIIFVWYFLFLCLHEYVHFLVAKRLGYKMTKLKLSLFGAVLYGETDAFSDLDEIYIALSAPLFNLSVSVIIVAIWWVFPTSYLYTMDICAINLVIFLFNVLPFFPLDGGRAFCALISNKISRKSATKICKIITLCFGIFLFVLFCFSIFFGINFNLLIISLSLVISILFEDNNARFEKCVAFYSKNNLKTYSLRTYVVFENIKLGKLYQKINKREYVCFVVNFTCGEKIKLFESDLIPFLEKFPLSSKLKDIIDKNNKSYIKIK